MHDDLTRKEKAVMSMTIGFALSFNFLFFGMLYIYINNHVGFPVTIGEVTFAAAVTFLSAGIIISGILFIIPEKLYSILASCAAGILVAGYMQSSFLNNLVNLGALTGDEIEWGNYTGYSIFGLVIWIIIIALPVIVRYFTPTVTWKRCIFAVCAILTGMQAIVLLTAYITSDREQMHYKPQHYLSREGIYEVSSIGNVIVFVIDRLDYRYIDMVRESDPAFFDRLDGFTDFTNTAAVYLSTFPAGVQISTGIPYDYQLKRIEYFNYAWNNSPYIESLLSNDYKMYYHIGSGGYYYTDLNQLNNIAHNIKDGKLTTSLHSIMYNFTVLSAYRNSPLMIKQFYWLPTVTFNTANSISEYEYVSVNDPLFMEILKENGLKLQNKNPNYIYIHLNGSHTPYTMNENSIYVEQSDVIRQTKGSFNIIYHYIDEMKRLNVYEDSTIVILGDHANGDHARDGGYNIGFFVKPKGSVNNPIIQNDAPVSLLDNLSATILKSEGIEHQNIGISVFDVAQDSLGERYAVIPPSGEVIEFYKIVGHVRDWNSWELIETRNFRMDWNNALPID